MNIYAKNTRLSGRVSNFNIVKMIAFMVSTVANA